MNKDRLMVLLSGIIFLFALSAAGQTPLARPLSDFDGLAAKLRAASVVGQSISVGETTIVPFAKISFGLGGGGAMMGFGGGMGGKTIPLGILIVEGDDVRAELFPEPEEKPSLLRDILQAILDRKVVIMGNGLNTGDTSVNPRDMASLLESMMGKTTFVGNALNVGHLKPQTPGASASAAKPASLEELKKLYEAKKYDEALSMADAMIAKDPKDSELHVWKGRIMGALTQSGDMADMMKYGPGAMEEFEVAVELGPKNPDALLGRGVSKLMAPEGFGGDVDGAVADIEAAISIKPSPEAYFYLGEANKRKGLNDKAAAAYRQALKLRPDYPEASKALAEIK
jgi:uncharacterized spore protein YtfJ